MIVTDPIDYRFKDLYFPEMLLGKVTFIFTFEINDQEEKLLNDALILLAKQFEVENKQDIRSVVFVFTEDGSINLKMPTEAMAMVCSICIFPVKRWRDRQYNNTQILTILLEEMCHHFWGIEDEVEVTYKVLEVMKNHYTNLTITDLYIVEDSTE